MTPFSLFYIYITILQRNKKKGVWVSAIAVAICLAPEAARSQKMFAL
jgi:hypothetical protein